MSRIVESLYRILDIKLNESRISTLCDKFNVTDFMIERALDFMYGEDRDNNIDVYTDSMIKEALDYYFESSQGYDYDHYNKD